MRESDFGKTLAAMGVREGRLLAAVSGGRDSMVLLDLLLRVRDSIELEVVVAHVNHGLRGESADADERHVGAAAARAGLAFHAIPVDPEASRRDTNSRSRPTLEEAARNDRIEALRHLAERESCGWIATAHHAGDQAETVLLRVLRGAGPDGLAAMAAQSADGRWIRPLLGVLPAEIADWATRHAVEWREDESNQDRRFARNQLRHDWIPGLAETFNPQLLRTLANLAEAGRRDVEWIDSLVREAAEERIEIGPNGIELAIDGWDALPEALARRLVRFSLGELGIAREISRAHILRALEFLKRGRRAGRDKRLEFPEGIVLRRRDDVFELSVDAPRKRFSAHVNATVQARE